MVSAKATLPEAVTIIENRTPARSQDQGFCIEEVTTLEEFESLRSEWDALVDRLPRPSIYLTHTWFLTWWRCHSSSRTSLWILLVRRSGALVAIAPFMRVRGSFLCLPHYRLEFIAMMHHAYSPLNCSGSLEMLVAEDAEDFVNAVMEHIRDHTRQWDMVRLNPLPERSPSLVELPRTAADCGIMCVTRLVYHNAIVEIKGLWEEYMAGRSKQFRKHLRSFERTVAERGDIRLREYATLDDLPGGFDGLLAIERKSWKAEKGFAIDAPQYRDFYRVLMNNMANRGALRVFVLTVGDHQVAYDVCLELRGRVESLKSSYDAELRALSPGAIMTMLEIRTLFNEKKESLNLLWGDLAYKTRWSTRTEPHHEAFLFHGGIYSRFLHFVYIRLSLYRLSRHLWNLALRRPFLREWMCKKD